MSHSKPMDRMPALAEDEMSPQQQSAYAALTQGPRGKVAGPFVALLRSPELMDRLQRVGEYLRFSNTIGLRCSEFAVLVCSRHWSQPVEWAIHRPIAEREGVSPQTCDAILQGRRPLSMSDDECIVYDVLDELYRCRSVSDLTWARLVDRWGDQGAIDLLAHYGYYSTLAIVMNACRTAVPESPFSEQMRSLPGAPG
ncbi:MAG: carboxymuconolactone decarboxylase family protein [Betaproteobacteria bacterium]|jgi:4-carboxymuconolactone decarboxylase|nr:carboxymuconolactone decarboxylase family protein [Betaproteobacteria bacterium]